jgi:hypothetical protein
LFGREIETSQDDHAEIVRIAKKGWLGHRPEHAPIEPHRRLRELGFTATTRTAEDALTVGSRAPFSLRARGSSRDIAPQKTV